MEFSKWAIANKYTLAQLLIIISFFATALALLIKDTVTFKKKRLIITKGGIILISIALISLIMQAMLNYAVEEESKEKEVENEHKLQSKFKIQLDSLKIVATELNSVSIHLSNLNDNFKDEAERNKESFHHNFTRQDSILTLQELYKKLFEPYSPFSLDVQVIIDLNHIGQNLGEDETTAVLLAHENLLAHLKNIEKGKVKGVEGDKDSGYIITNKYDGIKDFAFLEHAHAHLAFNRLSNRQINEIKSGIDYDLPKYSDLEIHAEDSTSNRYYKFLANNSFSNISMLRYNPKENIFIVNYCYEHFGNNDNNGVIASYDDMLNSVVVVSIAFLDVPKFWIEYMTFNFPPNYSRSQWIWFNGKNVGEGKIVFFINEQLRYTGSKILNINRKI